MTAGGDYWVVDAVHNEKFNPERYGLDFTVQLASAIANSETLAARPKKGDVYSAKTDLEKVLVYAREHFPEANLMAVEGLVDAWGASMCIGPGDGWAYYFYNPRRRDFEVLFAAADALARGDCSVAGLASYEARWRREIGRELADAVRIQRRLFARHALADAVVAAAARDPRLCRLLARVALGEEDYRRRRLALVGRFLLAALRGRISLAALRGRGGAAPGP